MKLLDIYEIAVKNGLKTDPRTKKELKEVLNGIRREFASLKKNEKKSFDKELLKHPFADTRILFGDINKDIHSIMVGIDIEQEELITAYLLNERGQAVDLAMSHHPSGVALSNLHYVMSVQANLLHRLGLSLEIAKSLMKDRMEEVSRRVSPRNHDRSVDIAKLLGIPFMCVHTPADNHVMNYLQNMFDRRKPKKLKDILSLLESIPEYRDGMLKGAGPRIIIGKPDNKAGKIFVDMTGGTEGSKKIFGRLSQAGVTTIVGMHMSDEHFDIAKTEFVNVIIAGHIASDNLGLNLVLDKLMEKERLNIIPCSGFVRVKR